MHILSDAACKCFIYTQLDDFGRVILAIVPTEDWITQEEAAQKLHVALDTMRRWVRQGHFPRTKVGKRYLIPIKALDDFLQSRLEYGARPVTPRKRVLPKKKAKKSPPH
jgi:excisionase family DNA binding protein